MEKMYKEANDAASVSKMTKEKNVGDAKVAKLYTEVCTYLLL